MDHVHFEAARSQPARQPETVTSRLVGHRNARDYLSGLHRLVPQRSSSSNSTFSSGTSFFNGWRATPGIIPATSQLVLLISTTATNVSSWLNGIRHLDKSLLCGMGP